VQRSNIQVDALFRGTRADEPGKYRHNGGTLRWLGAVAPQSSLTRLHASGELEQASRTEHGCKDDGFERGTKVADVGTTDSKKQAQSAG
jgi:hypothetical protein